MNLKLRKIQRQGTENQEYVSIFVRNDCNLKDYILADSTFLSDGKTPSNKLRHMFRLPKLDVDKGEFLRIYTGKGKYHVNENSYGKIIHYIYLGIEECIWNNDRDCGILFEISGSEYLPSSD